MGLGCTLFSLLSHPSPLKGCQYQTPYRATFVVVSLYTSLLDFSCERGTRTPDLKVMSLASYHCYNLAIYLNVKELQLKNPIRFEFSRKLSYGICFTKIGKNSHSVKSFFVL